MNVAATPANYGAPQAIGELLFTQYSLPFEVTAVILLVAVVGAILLARPDRPARRLSEIRAQAEAQRQEENPAPAEPPAPEEQPAEEKQPQ